jgi:hypothetical protein
MEDLASGLAATICQTAQLVPVIAFSRQLDQLIEGIGAATVSQTAQLVQVAALGGQLD